MKDVIFVQPAVVVLVTDKRIAYMKKYVRRGLVRNWKLRWQIPIHHVTKIQGNGLKLRVDVIRRSHSILMCGMSYLKSYSIDCATTSKFRSLVVRLNKHVSSEDADQVDFEGLPWLEALAHNNEEVSIMHALDTPLLPDPSASCTVEDVPMDVPASPSADADADADADVHGGGVARESTDPPPSAAEEIAPAPVLPVP